MAVISGTDTRYFCSLIIAPDIVRFQREGDPQLFQHRVVIHPTLQRQLRGRIIFAALVIDKAVKETRQDNVRAANKALFILFRRPVSKLAAVDSIAESARMRTISLLLTFRV